MPLAGLEPTIWAGERPQTYALDRAATGTGILHYLKYQNKADAMAEWYLQKKPKYSEVTRVSATLAVTKIPY